MTWVGIVLLIIAALLAFKVTAFLVRLVLIGVALLALYLIFGPMLGA